ncbi:MAG: lipopolysaccharide biosynthesis protein [Hyphomicrobium sp.]
MLLRQTILYLPAQVVGPVFQFVSAVVWTYYLSPAEMGAFALIAAAQELVYLGSLFWFSLYTVRYFDGADDAPARAAYLDTELALFGASTAGTVLVVMVLPLLISAHWSPQLVAASAAYMASRALVTHLTDRARTEADTLAYTVLQSMWPVAGLGLGLGLIALLGPSAAAVLWGYALAQLLSLAFAVWRLGFGSRPTAASREMVGAALTYGLPLVIGAVLVWVANNGVRFVVEWSEGAAAVGLVTVGWALGLRAAAFAAMLVTAAAFPLAVRRARDGGMAEGQAQLERNGILLMVALAPAAGGLWAVSEPLVRLIIAEPYRDMTIAVLPLAIVAGALRNFRIHFGEQVFLLHENPKVPLVNDAIDAVATIAGAAIGLHLGGLPGVVAGAAVGTMASLVVTLAVAWRWYRFALPLKDFAKLAAASTIMVVVVRMLPTQPTALGLAIAMAVGVAVYATALLGLYPEARGVVLTQARRLAGKRSG